MKKTIRALLVLILFSCSLAIADTEQEITFRDIPWGVTFDNAKTLLESQGLRFALQNAYSKDATEYTRRSHGNKYTGLYGNETGIDGQYWIIYELGATNLKVAGFDVYGVQAYSDPEKDYSAAYRLNNNYDNIKLYFMPLLDESGTALVCSENGKPVESLYRAQYSFIAPVKGMAAEDMGKELLEKLDSVYGEHKASTISKSQNLTKKNKPDGMTDFLSITSINYQEKQYIWNGGQGTSVVLRSFSAGDHFKEVVGYTIIYNYTPDQFNKLVSDLDAASELKAREEQEKKEKQQQEAEKERQKKEEEEKQNGGTDGL